MPPSFRNSLRELISSLLPMSITKNVLGSVAGNMAVPLFNLPIAIIIWVELVMALLCPWNDQSKGVWTDLLGYRIDKACLCKNLSGSEHEFIVVEFSNDQKQILRLRVERAIGERKDSQSTATSSSMTSLETDSDVSPSPRRSTSPCSYRSRSSSPASSVNESLAKTTGSLVHQLSSSSVLESSALSFNGHLAADTVTNIDSFPKKVKTIRTIDFNSTDRSQRPSLWDVMILSYVIHQDSTAYDLWGRQCFWFADTISAILEKWSETCKGVSVKNTIKARFFKLNASPGKVKGFSIHRRNSEDVDKIWAQFLKQQEEMNNERQSYENTKTQEVRKAEELAEQVEELRQQRACEMQKWEEERKEWEEREYQLMKEQEEREHRLKQQIAEQGRMQEQMQQQLLQNGYCFHELEQRFKAAQTDEPAFGFRTSRSRRQCH